ncbi:hypothetical protein DFH07DRAFT_783640 [Mycena maculata]|uniref:Uncharacterized protein n=1 Tax=Mycena maculata TaxID=230809 RepID=A0AAD7MLK9_9AGAR|nr:hypothetical protein DFH07DRAFT_783640 [Mycena maculata]
MSRGGACFWGSGACNGSACVMMNIYISSTLKYCAPWLIGNAKGLDLTSRRVVHVFGAVSSTLKYSVVHWRCKEPVFNTSTGGAFFWRSVSKYQNSSTLKYCALWLIGDAKSLDSSPRRAVHSFGAVSAYGKCMNRQVITTEVLCPWPTGNAGGPDSTLRRAVQSCGGSGACKGSARGVMNIYISPTLKYCATWPTGNSGGLDSTLQSQQISKFINTEVLRTVAHWRCKEPGFNTSKGGASFWGSGACQGSACLMENIYIVEGPGTNTSKGGAVMLAGDHPVSWRICILLRYIKCANRQVTDTELLRPMVLGNAGCLDSNLKGWCIPGISLCCGEDFYGYISIYFAPPPIGDAGGLDSTLRRVVHSPGAVMLAKDHPVSGPVITPWELCNMNFHLSLPSHRIQAGNRLCKYLLLANKLLDDFVSMQPNFDVVVEWPDTLVLGISTTIVHVLLRLGPQELLRATVDQIEQSPSATIKCPDMGSDLGDLKTHCPDFDSDLSFSGYPFVRTLAQTSHRKFSNFVQTVDRTSQGVITGPPVS